MSEEVKEEVVDSRTTEELDKLADHDISASNSERPMTGEPPKVDKKEADGFEFIHNGKTVKANLEQLKKWAQQGYDYPQRAQKLNQEKAKWESDRQKWEEQRTQNEKIWESYRKIDELAKKDPQWWGQVEALFKGYGQTQIPQVPGQPIPLQNDPYASKFQNLEQKLSQFEPLIQQIVQERQQMVEKAQDQELDREIQSIREAHADLDWKSLDENGKTLEVRVLEHAQQNGIPTFRVAFRDLLHEELVNKAQAQGKIAVAKGIQNKTKLGILGEPPMPNRTRASKDIRRTSYEELEHEIREDLKLGRIR